MKKFFALLALVLCLSFTFVQSPASADGTVFSRDGYVGYVDGDTVFSRDGYVGYVDGDTIFSRDGYVGYVDGDTVFSRYGYVGYVDGDVDNAAKGAAELLLLK